MFSFCAHPAQEDIGEHVASILGDRCVGMRPDAVMHVPPRSPTWPVPEAATLGADGCVTVGGGSTIGLGKAIALSTGLPIVAVPTTYAGSEMTPIWGLTDGGAQEDRPRSAGAARSVIYDPS